MKTRCRQQNLLLRRDQLQAVLGRSKGRRRTYRCGAALPGAASAARAPRAHSSGLTGLAALVGVGCGMAGCASSWAATDSMMMQERGSMG